MPADFPGPGLEGVLAGSWWERGTGWCDLERTVVRHGLVFPIEACTILHQLHQVEYETTLGCAAERDGRQGREVGALRWGRGARGCKGTVGA